MEGQVQETTLSFLLADENKYNVDAAPPPN
jgi:hypothetical protein